MADGDASSTARSRSSKYANVQFEPGDRVRLWTPGGGGYGDPGARDPALIEEDLREGYVSEASAARDYGYAGATPARAPVAPRPARAPTPTPDALGARVPGPAPLAG